MEIADRAADHEAVFGEFGGPAGPNQERHVAARLQETPAEIAADRARSDHENSHLSQPSLLWRVRRPMRHSVSGRHNVQNGDGAANPGRPSCRNRPARRFLLVLR
jgi:hypothetical protein